MKPIILVVFPCITKLAQILRPIIEVMTIRWKIIRPSIEEKIDHEAENSWIIKKTTTGKKTKDDNDDADEEEEN